MLCWSVDGRFEVLSPWERNEFSKTPLRVSVPYPKGIWHSDTVAYIRVPELVLAQLAQRHGSPAIIFSNSFGILALTSCLSLNVASSVLCLWNQRFARLLGAFYGGENTISDRFLPRRQRPTSPQY